MMLNIAIKDRVSLLVVQVADLQENITMVDNNITGWCKDVNFCVFLLRRFSSF